MGNSALSEFHHGNIVINTCKCCLGEGVVFVSSFVALFLEVMSSALFVEYLCIIFGCTGSLAAVSGGFSSWEHRLWAHSFSSCGPQA